MTELIMQTEGLAIGYGVGSKSKRVLKDGIDANLCSGELVCLVGPNGAGKSTLLRTLAGLQPALGGHVYFKGVLKKYDAADADWVDIHKLTPRQLARRISVVLTEPVDGDGLSAYTLTALGRHPYTDWRGRTTPADEAVVIWALQAVGAAGLAGRPLTTLSDGERQKISIARALAQEPDLIILDEPTAFLDLPHRIEIMHTLKHLARSIGQAILLSTHDLDQALQNADRLWLLPMQGALVYGAPEDLILSGDFEAAFSSDLSPSSPTIFDQHSGTFTLVNGSSGEITLQGEGLAAEWTGRALKREGYNVVSSITDQSYHPHLSIEVLQTPAKNLWRLFNGHQDARDYTSIYDLISALRNIHEQ
jgi:iron complex transport system ATP-binding protein